MRYIVQMKPALTCDDAQSPWSTFWRDLLCKQGVAGSSPVVSTVKALVKAGLMPRDIQYQLNMSPH